MATLALSVLCPLFSTITSVMSILALCGSIILMSGSTNLAKANTFFNKKVLSIGKPVKKMDEDIGNIDNWVMKRPQLAGAIIFIVSLALLLNQYMHMK